MDKFNEEEYRKENREINLYMEELGFIPDEDFQDLNNNNLIFFNPFIFEGWGETETKQKT